jgi:hypothetical protein
MTQQLKSNTLNFNDMLKRDEQVSQKIAKYQININHKNHYL